MEHLKTLLIVGIILCALGIQAQELADCPAICPTIYDPVCGSNGVKYDNLCELKDADCKDEANEITYDAAGACITD